MYKEMFEYHLYFNNQMIKVFEEETKTLPERTFPLFCHVLNAHQMWNARVLNEQPLGANQIHDLDKCKIINRKNYDNSLKIIQKFAMNQSIKYANSKGTKFTNLLSDILFHIVNHSTHHKGQIISDFRNSGVEPMITDYIFYKRQ